MSIAVGAALVTAPTAFRSCGTTLKRQLLWILANDFDAGNSGRGLRRLSFIWFAFNHLHRTDSIILAVDSGTDTILVT